MWHGGRFKIAAFLTSTNQFQYHVNYTYNTENES